MRVLFLGDIVGRAARNAVIAQLADLRQDLAADFAVVNCENAAGGFGITPAICDDLFAAGADVLTTGNHVWDKREIFDYIAAEPRLLRPLNMAEGSPGSGVSAVTNEAGQRLTVVNVMTNLFMAPNDPVFAALDGALVRNRLGRDADFILVDVHGEATSEKWRLVIWRMGGHRLSWERTPISRLPIIMYCLVARPIRQMPACVAIMTVSSVWIKRWRPTGSLALAVAGCQ